MNLTKYSLLLIIPVFVFSCKSDDSRSCTTCNSPQTTEFEVCEESDGNASVNGENTGTRFDIYLADLQAAGASCGI
ncbi:hypothetical protein [Constantimarinum furrinae]|uniref:Uncharacterized protein n=1 Tax=Constantimarinum furrinae TaxID=2562285 RepID=A0A7G8PT56_9FLAO|nr:hypothetical protein [Constantimarinum furrinae]QNJ97522.1 hypothetical protein ALE3EI_0947 [Constantimarinum furrinae]